MPKYKIHQWGWKHSAARFNMWLADQDTLYSNVHVDTKVAQKHVAFINSVELS